MIAAYCWPQSAPSGARIALHVSTTASHFDVDVVRQGASDEPAFQTSGIEGIEHAVPDDAGSAGCGWPGALEIDTTGMRTGFHLVRVRGDDGEEAFAFFVVRPTEPTSRALLVLSTSTWAAYNDWGGPSYYTGGHVSSLERPLPKGFLARPTPERLRSARMGELDPGEVGAALKSGISFWIVAAGWAGWEHLFVQWAEREGIAFDFAVSHDLEAVPGLLDPYDLYVSVGHDEYWSAGMRDAVESFVDAGGNAAFFSGNTAFWQIRNEDGGRRQVSYKMDLEADPCFESDPSRLSTMWSDPMVGRPENAMTGVSFTRGGYAHLDNAPRGTGGYAIWRPRHWAFDGLDLWAGDVLGAEPIVVGYECDGCELTLRDGLPVPTGNDGTPASFEVLGTAPAHLWESNERPGALPADGVGELNWVAERLAGADTPENRARFAHGHAVMGHFTRGQGQVFTTGCTDWAFGLGDPAVARVTKNVIGRFLG